MSPWRTLQCFKPGAVEPRAGERQHVERQIEAEPALDIGREQFEHAPGAGAEIEQRADRLVGERRADGVFHRGVGDVELADAVPLRGMTPEIILRGGGARGAHRGQPLAVAHDDRIVGIKPPDQAARDVGAAAAAGAAGALGQAEKRPRAFAEALDQSGLGQKPQMARQPRLRLAQDFGELGDGQLGFGEQDQDAQARRLGRGFERCGQPGEAQLLIDPSRYSRSILRYKDIFISLSRRGKVPSRWDLAQSDHRPSTPSPRRGEGWVRGFG